MTVRRRPSSSGAVPAGPYTVSGAWRSRRSKDLSRPGRPSQWSRCRWVRKTSSTSARPTVRSSWRCVPSPQSNSRRSPPRRTSSAGRPRRAVGTEPAVPAKNSERSIDVRGYRPLSRHYLRRTRVLKEFRQFILRGNVIDLAVAVVIGAAFKSVVDALVADFVTPLIAAIGGKPDFSELHFTINSSVFKYGAFLNELISFV